MQDLNLNEMQQVDGGLYIWDLIEDLGTAIRELLA